MKTQTKQLLIRGMKVTYDVTNEGPAMVFIHGWAGCRLHWRQAPSYLPKQRVVSPDLYGFGDSEEPPHITIPDDYVDLIRMLVDELKIESCILVGHSVGGLIAASLASRFPEKVTGLVLIEAPVGKEFHPKCPLLLVFGDKDSDMEGLSRLDIANAQKACNPLAQVCFIEHAGHNPMLEQPFECYANLRVFAQKCHHSYLQSTVRRCD
jgi:pimeloyl-ACP methyl ester carboxylesterase